jgi:hypothetical protein
MRARVEQARTRRQVLEARRRALFRARVRISSIGRRDYIGAVRPTG